MAIRSLMEDGAMNIVYFLLIGIIAGWLAGKLVRGRGFGLIGDLIVGVLGAVVGGFLFSLLGVSAYGLLGSLVMSALGAVVLLYVIGVLKRA